MADNAEKPEYEEWLHWGRVVIDRLSSCAQVYSKPLYDKAMPQESRQSRNHRTIDLLRRLEAMVDETDTPSDSLIELDHHGERVIDGLAVLFRESLRALPELSADMQKLLKSPWREKCNGRLADELFRGPMGYEPEGIGSGLPEDGRLPEMLADLLEREEAGDGRLPRETLPDIPERHDDVARRWGANRFLRSAGRVE